MQEVQRDNLALYKKLRYVQADQRRGNSTAGSTRRTYSSGSNDREDRDMVAAESRYADMYEREMDPFRAFAAGDMQVHGMIRLKHYNVLYQNCYATINLHMT